MTTYTFPTTRRAANEAPGTLAVMRTWWAASRKRRGQVTLSLLAAIIACARFTSSHGLVVGGLAAFTVAAWVCALPLGLLVGGFGLMFLEWRRK